MPELEQRIVELDAKIDQVDTKLDVVEEKLEHFMSESSADRKGIRAKLEEEHRDNVHRLIQLQRDVRCLSDGIKSFQDKYTATLDLAKNEHADAAELRKVIMEKTVASLIWAGLVLIGTALWFYVKGKILS